jgi:hypothetical protein
MGLHPESPPRTFPPPASSAGIIEPALAVPGPSFLRPTCARTRTSSREPDAGQPPMKPLRLVSTPTRNRRLNEILGLVVLVSAALLFLALATYTPTDPSANTVGGYAPGARPAHNWTGLAGAWLADAILQTIGIAAFFLPIVLGRVGLCWMRQRAAGSAKARFLGLALWIVFAPAAIGLLPHASSGVTRCPSKASPAACSPTPWCTTSTSPAPPSSSPSWSRCPLSRHHLHLPHRHRVGRDPPLLRPPHLRQVAGWRARRALAREAKRVLREDHPNPPAPSSPAPASRPSSRPPSNSSASA